MENRVSKVETWSLSDVDRSQVFTNVYNYQVSVRLTLFPCLFPLLTHLFSILHLLSRTLQCVLKSSKSFRHLRSCWQTDSAWLHVGRASIGYGSFSAASRR